MERKHVWNSRPVFITSTFQDMQAERDLLRQKVFPSLEEWLRTHRRHLEWIDLRVGVASASAKEEEAREFHVLKVCLAEVARCRPFVIALIGNRYGWVPQKDRMQAAAIEAGFTSDITERSVTDLEIDFGVFHNADLKRRCLFFLRRPLPYETMGAQAAVYSDEYATDSQAELRRDGLAKLKARITSDFADRCFEYSAGWDERAGRVTGLEEFGRLVESKVRQALEDDLADAPPAAEADDEDIDRAELADFAEDRARDFVGRQDTLSAIEALLASPAVESAPRGLCITGEAGSGKSALFGTLYQRLTGQGSASATGVSDEQRAQYERIRSLDPIVLAQSAGLSQRAASVDQMLRRWICELARHLGQEPYEWWMTARPDTVDEIFRNLFQRAAQRRVIVLLDAIDQFEPTPRGRFVTWLPHCGPNVRLVATATPGEASNALSKREGIALEALPPLDVAQARRIVAAISARYHRVLEKEVIDTLVARDSRSWCNPLWLVLAAEELNLLDADDFARAAKQYPGRDDEKLRALMCDMAAGFPADIPGMYKAGFERAAALYGRKSTEAFLALIAVSRSGWRESDFREVLPQLADEAWDELRFAQLRRSFRGQLRRHGVMGQWDFANVHMRAAAKTWIAGGFKEANLHAVLGDHLLQLPRSDPLHVSETMFHLMRRQDGCRAAAVYLGAIGIIGEPSLSEQETSGAMSVLADLILGDPEPLAGTDYVNGLLEADGIEDEMVGVIAGRLFELNNLLRGYVPLDVHLALYRAVAEIFEKRAAEQPDYTHFDWLYLQADALARFTEVVLLEGLLDVAENFSRKTLGIRERIAERNPYNWDWQADLSQAWSSLGDVLASRSNAEEAMEAYEKALKIAKRVKYEQPRLWRPEAAVMWLHWRFGNLLALNGQIPEALEAFQESEGIANRTSDDPNGLFAKAYTIRRIGELRLLQGRLWTAHIKLDEGLRRSTSLLNCDPGNAHWQYELACAQLSVGALRMAELQLPDALTMLRGGLAISQRLLEVDPGNRSWRQTTFDTLEKIGQVLMKQKAFEQAEKAFRDQLAVTELASRYQNRNEQPALVTVFASMNIGDAVAAQGKRAQALTLFRQGLGLVQPVLDQQPGHKLAKHAAAEVHLRIGDVIRQQRDQKGALEQFETGLKLARSLVRFDPTNDIWRGVWARLCEQRAGVLLSMRRNKEAEEDYREVLTIYGELIQDEADNPGWHQTYIDSFLNVGKALVAQGKREEAVKILGEGIAATKRAAEIPECGQGREDRLAAFDRAIAAASRRRYWLW